jgi:hypothetical protein
MNEYIAHIRVNGKKYDDILIYEETDEEAIEDVKRKMEIMYNIKTFTLQLTKQITKHELVYSDIITP